MAKYVGSTSSSATNWTTSTALVVASGSCSKSSASRITIRPSGISYPLAISAYGISLPHFSQTRLYLIRPPSSGWT